MSDRPIINHIGVSGGKDSTALLLWALHESGYPKESLDFTFCDTDNEHDWTYDHIVMLSEHSVANGGPRIKWLKPDLGFYDLARFKQRFPSPRARFCTLKLKIEPTMRYVERLVALGFDVVLHSGVRADESDERAKLVAREEVREHVSEYRALLTWTIEDVWALHRRHGIPPNPLYGIGASRVGCLLCIMSKKAWIAKAATQFPQYVNRIRSAEESFHPDNPSRYQPFFGAKMVPMRFRSRKVRRASDGKEWAIATIDDVVRWATEKPHVQTEFKELDHRTEDKTMCQSTWGSCE